MHPWDNVLEGKCQTLTLQLLKSVPFRSSKSPSRIENILCFQITLLLLGSQHNSFVFYPKSMGIRGPAEVLALPCSEHARQQYVGGLLSCQAPPAMGKPRGRFPPCWVLNGYHPAKDAGEYETHLHHLLGQDGVAGWIMGKDRSGNLLTVLQSLGWEPIVGQARGVEELVHLGRGKQSRCR